MTFLFRNFAIAAVLILASCGNKKTLLNKFNNPDILKIADLQDRRSSDSLQRYFIGPYRKEAVMAIASTQDTTLIPVVGNMLQTDTSQQVREACAFALGQMKNVKAEPFLIAALEKAKGKEVELVLESLGKVSTDAILPKSIDTTDVHVARGDSWRLYRLGLRGKGNGVLKRALFYLKSNDLETRLAAAHFFNRSSIDIDTTNAEAFETLRSALSTDSSADVRMALALSLRKWKTKGSLDKLTTLALGDNDYRVRVNAIRALQAFDLKKTFNVLQQALGDQNINTAIMASEVLKANATEPYWKVLAAQAQAAENFRVQANLYEAVLIADPNKELTDEVMRVIKVSNNPYQKALLITALQHSPIASTFIATQLFSSDVPVVRSTAAAALVAINKSKSFDKHQQEQFNGYYLKAMTMSDPAVIGTIASALSDPDLGYKQQLKDFSFLYAARKKLSIPRDHEALQPLVQAIAYFEGKKAEDLLTKFNHPIHWELAKQIPTHQEAVIKTSKGDITIHLLIEEAPGSVVNFIELARSHYFDGKAFHRVVPNFVIQGGCHRGDGWGSEDYSIRSEFSMRKYKTGSVGMASAGKDTEGTQWFISHSPTPHLDGGYSIFAEVSSGMDVVHHIEMGDTILEVKLLP